MCCKFRRFSMDVPYLQNASRLIGRLCHRKIPRQYKRFIHIQTTNQLLLQNISSTIAGDNHRKQTFICERSLAKECRQTIDKGRQICPQRIVIVWAEKHKSIALLQRRIYFLDNRSSVKAAGILAEIHAHIIRTSGTVQKRTISKRNFLYRNVRRKLYPHLSPKL